MLFRQETTIPFILPMAIFSLYFFTVWSQNILWRKIYSEYLVLKSLQHHLYGLEFKASLLICPFHTWIMLQQTSADAKMFIWWLWGLCGPRRNHGNVWKMLLLSTWGGCSKTELPRATKAAPGCTSPSPKGYFKVSESNPTLGYCCLIHAKSMATPWDTAWTIAINHCLLYFSICTGKKKILYLGKGGWEMWWEQTNSFWPYFIEHLLCWLAFMEKPC